MASLSDDDKERVRNVSHFYYAGYDAPFKLFFRRNDIWIPVDKIKQ